MRLSHTLSVILLATSSASAFASTACDDMDTNDYFFVEETSLLDEAQLHEAEKFLQGSLSDERIRFVLNLSSLKPSIATIADTTHH